MSVRRMLVPLLVLCTVLITARAADCPVHCECSTSDVITLECDGVVVTARDDGYAEINCQGGAWNCSGIPPFHISRGAPLKRLEVKQCLTSGNGTGQAVELMCAVEASGAHNIESLAVLDASSDLTADNVRGLDMIRSLYVAALPDAVSSIPIEAIKSLPLLLSIRLLSLSSPPLPGEMFLSTPPVPVERLEIAMSGLGRLGEKAFFGLNKLKVLSLWKNDITDIHVGAFKGLDSLEELLLNSNPLQSLSVGLFVDNKRLRRLCLERIKLNVLQDGVLQGLEYLQELKFRNEVELTLSPSSLSHLPSLTSLQLSHSHISSLPPTIFYNSSNIINMTLNNNNISHLPERLFSELTKLVRLDISYNNIEVVNREMFVGLKSLVDVKLDGNKIQVLPDRLFSGLTHLTSISLSHNLISTISLSTFVGVEKLSTLLLGDNRLRWGREDESGEGDFFVEPSSPFNMLRELKILSLRNNNISYVYSDWRFVLLQLNKLDLSHNAFTELTASDMQFLHNSIEVDFRYNQITTVSPFYSFSPSLSRILLSYNPFLCSCNLYHFLTQIKSNIIYYNVDEAMCNLPLHMRNTLLTSVKLTDITCPVYNVSEHCNCLIRPDKQRIECDCVQLSDLPDPIALGLDSLSLKLQSVSNEIKNLPEFVTQLNISNVGLTTIPKIPKTVKHLDISNNHLEKIPTELLNRNLTLKLSNNPIICDCWTTDDVILLKNNSKLIEDYKEVTCFPNRKLNILDPYSLCNVYKSTLSGSLVAFIGLLLGVIVALLYRYRIEIQVYMYSKKICLYLLPKETQDYNKMYDVFVSFAPEDEKFVCQEILPHLEGRYILHVQDRDWEVGDTIPTQIRQSIELSSRTLIILTDNFLKSIWSSEELRTIHSQAANDRRLRAVVVIKTNKQLDKHTKTYLSLATNIKWGEKLFWEKLIYALPRKDMYRGERGERREMKGRKSELVMWKGECLNVMLNEEGKLVNCAYIKE